MTENELIVPAERPRELLEIGPGERLDAATLIANELKRVVVEQGMTTKIGKGVHVNVEGWQTLAFLCGLNFVESEVTRLDTYWEASVNLINSQGRILGHGSAICTHEEAAKRGWAENNCRSMAITRAIGKCGRVALGWVMQLAGYNPCPTEEMVVLQAQKGETGPAPGVGQIPQATEPAPVVEYTTPPPAPEPVPLTESEQSVLAVIVKCGQKGDGAGLAELRESLNARRETLTPQAALAFRGAIKLADAECNAAEML